ncbi:30S ribosomal protein S15 [Candidatus Pantoea edessiphila]|uniref:Small ribosomal subunit protein uS15 n=1 Tax=Candidatus Pantoea edessiphila TaxID=2044610 RepID=A0A2P5SW70_9GAMM|nr:30S ribosomal protein S15 [Candidatus Pantoea edessiphila]PPI86560.1 30S ribosomal protein S15 [Candidatus Pantoea edessiphila]
MFVNLELKKEIIANYGKNTNDNGRSEVQIALLTFRINHLQEHFSQHKKDYHSRMGLLRIVSQRRKLLDYLKHKDIIRYTNLIDNLNIRR